MEKQSNWNSQNNLEIWSKVGSLTWPNFKIYCKAAVISTVGTDVREKTLKQLDQWSTMDGIETDAQIYSQLIFDKGTKEIQ